MKFVIALMIMSVVLSKNHISTFLSVRMVETETQVESKYDKCLDETKDILHDACKIAKLILEEKYYDILPILIVDIQKIKENVKCY